jgi:RNA polymerase sigma-70 factor (ECF subfamily)
MNLSEDELLAHAGAGNEAALSALLERYGPPLCKELKIGPKWRSLVDADDVMQVSYLEAFLRIRSFTPTRPGSFVAWLRRIAENNLRDAIKELERDKRPQNRIVDAPDESSYVAFVNRLPGTTTTPSRQAARHEIEGIVESALRQLPRDYEKVLRLYELEGRSGPEIAEILGRSHGAVKMLLARARERLLEILGSESKFFSSSA